MRRLELDIFYVSSRAVVLLFLQYFISDIGGYQSTAMRLVSAHEIPYLHWDFEYPPLAYVLTSIPAWILHFAGNSDLQSYRFVFGAFLLPFDFLLYWRFRQLHLYRGAEFAYVVLTFSMALLLFDRFDLVVGFLLAWPFLASTRPRLPSAPRSALCWGIGGAL